MRQIAQSSITRLAFVFTIAFFSCKKKDDVYRLEGKVINARTGQGVGGADVEIERTTTSNTVVSGGFSTAASDNSASDGSYSLEWPTERIVEAQVKASADNYFPRTLELRVDDFAPDETVTKNIALYPQASIRVHLQNTYTVNGGDVLIFSLPNAVFDCNCCSNDEVTYIGPLDSTYTCKVYGDTWIKYRARVASISQDSLSVDSIFCPSFQTTDLFVPY